MINLDLRINLLGQTTEDLIIEFSVPDEWSNIQAISKNATIQDFISLYEAITPDEVQDINDTAIIINNTFNA